MEMEIHHEQSYKAEIILAHREAEEIGRERLESGFVLLTARKKE